MNRQEATALILEAKGAKSITFEDIATQVGRHKVWTTAALLGQATMTKDEADAVGTCLGLGSGVVKALQGCPTRGSLDKNVPVDPLLYRFHGINQVYRATVQALIHEMFGDGIMSAIDFELDIQRVSDPQGDRVRITYNGKFLSYRKW